MLKLFFRYYKPYKALFCLDFSCAVIAGILELIFPFLVRYVIDSIIPNHDFSVILVIALGLFGFYALNTYLKYIVVYFGHMLGVCIENDMRRELFSHLQQQSFRYFDHTKTGTLMTRLTSDLFYISELAHHGPEDLFVTVMTLIGAFCLMYLTHPALAFITVIMVPLIAIVAALYNRKMEKSNHQVYDALAEFNVGIENTISGIRVVKAFANEAYEKQRFEKFLHLYEQAKRLFYKTMGNSSAFNYLFMRLINLFALFFGAYFTIHDGLSTGVLAGFILLTNVLVRPIELINIMIETYPKGFAGFRRLQEELKCLPEIVDAPHARAVKQLAGDIEYKHVYFQYNDEKTVLRDINLYIKKGEKVAFVGPSGAGKSTICHLLPRFYDVTGGDILIDNLSIKDITLESLRKQIGIVQQDVFLFGGTIKENILYGRLDASDEEVLKAIEQAHLSDVIKAMPQGMDTEIGERGVRLSGGQKQRLAIARILLKNPNILILDEATSALDTQTERIIQESFDILSKGRTTLIIAHRLATIQHVDRIIVVTPEGIMEEGSHEDLMCKKGYYYDLYCSQFR
ncbi:MULTISPECIES: ABC transporter ATP-binding protein [unclassified Granulicatella]|uniref:ABC transporter ATP-binding protein n=1 Tax=unclassified Granulicatella TaxID=2630493 RepID=UPI001073076B|nr:MULTISPECIES: ABC transporter ATP-binding protein [unclassified Granulicatella]MBF0780450.1 ABC transporter ATP-binding protein [Granulicatella sp. 19428wC4_WM01]TFU95394.1 ABC transporter ATP-binding protein [Granulicatella sp. WM01]